MRNIPSETLRQELVQFEDWLGGVEGLIGAALEPMATAGVTAVFWLGKDGNLKI